MLYVVRMALLGLNFLVVGVLGLLVGLARPFNPDNNRIFARLYSRPSLALMGLRLEADVTTLQAQPPGFVIIANHQSNFDVFFLGSIVPRRMACIGKKSLGWVPLFGQLFWLGGNVLLNRDNAYQARRALQTTSRVLRDQHTSIWIFPEGTRNPDERLLPFKKGAFMMAIDAGVPIVPVCASRYVHALDFNRRHSGDIRVRSLAPIPTQGLTAKDIPDLMARCEHAMQACIDELSQLTELQAHAPL
ncbi:lysophospholipid acyltransferase family protein [Pseudomonas japonica]|uniref:lysophospholipid acyltransferase family protein n=1 Tax=Pseudomonas japonica TaxID=256466 RepID=UPI0015E3BC4F|nr:lysophospholipid acyltransferase family protein [Pseudomonas japonica]MBA1244879.1 1-acyl-sn-glycerol-3-phosphate acyltransferase [Pseudomonas japonica]